MEVLIDPTTFVIQTGEKSTTVHDVWAAMRQARNLSKRTRRRVQARRHDGKMKMVYQGGGLVEYVDNRRVAGRRKHASEN